MSNFVLLYTGGNMPTNDMERQKIDQEWTSWFKKLDKAVIDQGNPFTPKAKNISLDGRVSDGADCPMITGYSIIQAMSLDAAIQLAKSCPALRNGTKISIYETMNIM